MKYILLMYGAEGAYAEEERKDCMLESLRVCEELARRFPSPEYLRKWCLVKEGYADHTEYPCETDEMASRLITMVRKMDPYAVITRAGNVLTIWGAQSQDHASMGHEIFQQSKDKVLGRIAMMCGISVAELTKNSKEAL